MNELLQSRSFRVTKNKHIESDGVASKSHEEKMMSWRTKAQKVMASFFREGTCLNDGKSPH
jgi:hypothetical protein